MSGIVKGARTGGLVAAALTAAGGLTMAASAQPLTTVASKVQIAIHEHGKNPTSQVASKGALTGTFTIELSLTPFGQGGTTRIYSDQGATRQVSGQTQIATGGVDTLTSKSGTLQLAFSGIQIPINIKLTSSGMAIGPAAEHGAWRIKAATGAYKGWTGGGVWAGAIDGYGAVQQYSVEWDGNITR